MDKQQKAAQDFIDLANAVLACDGLPAHLREWWQRRLENAQMSPIIRAAFGSAAGYRARA